MGKNQSKCEKTMHLDSTYKLMSILQTNRNMIYSYTGIQLGLMMIRMGSSSDIFNIGAKEYDSMLNNLRKLDGVTIASSLWINNNRRLTMTNFFEKEAKKYGKVIFKKFHKKKISKEINKFVEDISGRWMERIKKVGESDSIVLVNIFHFDCPWVNRFDKSKNIIRNFHVNDNKFIKCEYMVQYAKHKVVDDNNNILVMKFSNGCDFVAICPRHRYKAPTLSNSAILKYVDRAEEKSVYVEIPKFNRDVDVNMMSVLQQFGIQFTLGQHDKMVDPKLPLYVTKIEHQCRLSINEDGIMNAKCVGEPDTHIILNRPFTYAIVIAKLQRVLVVGTFQAKK